MRHCYGHPHALAYHGAMLVNDRRRAAEQGYADAQNCLGEMYEKGRGVPKDEAEAAKWYRKAAEQGEAIAQCKLGDMYAESRGVLQDDTEAVRWYRKAAEQGNAEAQFNLGCLFADGYTRFGGVAEDTQWRSSGIAWPPNRDTRVPKTPAGGTATVTGWRRIKPRRRNGIARRPRREMLAHSYSSAGCTRTAMASPRTMPRPFSGFARPPSRGTPTPRSPSA